MILGETGAILLIIIVTRIPIKDGRPPRKREAIPTKYLHGTATRPNTRPAKYSSGPV